MKIALIIAGALVGLVMLVAVIGALLPRDHTASASARFRATPDQLFALVSGPQTWRSTVKQYEELPSEGGRKRWRETDSHGETVEYEVVESAAPRRLKTRIASEGLPYGGTWTYELTAHGDETEVRITEDGQVYNPIFRFVGRFIIGYESSMRGYLKDLERASRE